MLQGVYECNQRLGRFPHRRQPAARPEAPRPRRAVGVLLGLTLLLGSALGYLTQSVLSDAPVSMPVAELQPAEMHPQPRQTVRNADSQTDGASLFAGYDPGMSDWPEQLPGIETGNWSDFDKLLSDDHLPLSVLFGVGVRTIVIDPGHGGRDPGAIGARGTLEKDVALDVALRLRDRLQKFGGYRILMTRETDKTLRLNERVKFANENRADLFISIHVNSFPDVRVKTIETYYFGAPPDSTSVELAKLENTDSHYGLAEFNSVIEKIGDTMKYQESAALAASIQYSLFNSIRKINHRVRNFGVKTAPFVVLLGVDAPSVLTEISCITNPNEEMKLNTPAYRENIASFLEKGVHNYLRHKRSLTAGDERYGSERSG